MNMASQETAVFSLLCRTYSCPNVVSYAAGSKAHFELQQLGDVALQGSLGLHHFVVLVLERDVDGNYSVYIAIVLLGHGVTYKW